MALTFKQVRQYYQNEMMEIALATQDQIDLLCIEVGDDHPQMVYSLAKDDLHYMLQEEIAAMKG
jgi:hypothetical protein